MGRGLLITVTLMVGVYSLIILNTQRNRKEIVRNTVSEAAETQARNTAHSGIELSLQRLKQQGWKYSSVYFPLSYQMGESNVQIDIKTPQNANLHYNVLQLRSTTILTSMEW